MDRKAQWTVLLLTVAGALALALAMGCAHIQDRKACRERCDRDHPGEKVRVLYGSPSDAYMDCVTACDRGQP